MKYKKDEKVFLALFLDNEPYENIKYKKIEMAIIPGKIRTHLGNNSYDLEFMEHEMSEKERKLLDYFYNDDIRSLVYMGNNTIEEVYFDYDFDVSQIHRTKEEALDYIRESAREVSKVFLDRQKDELEAIDKLLRDVKMLSMEVNNG
jgi:hypothetical protein